MKRFAILLVLAACGGDGNSSIDAPKSIDSPPSTVQAVTCPGSPAATVMTSGFMYSPMSTTITQGQIVQFVMPSSHNVVPGHAPSDSTIADPSLNVNFSETKCFMFTSPGSFGFHCGPHQFNGTIVVQ